MRKLSYISHHKYEYPEKEESSSCELYQAHDLCFNRTVALKRVEIFGSSEQEIKKNYDSAFREIKTMVNVAESSGVNLNIPKVYNYYWDEKNHVLYLISQWIYGESLRNKLRKVSEDVFLRWMNDLCYILKEMAKRKIYHKDIKPENILIDKSNTLFLVDFDITASLPNRVEGTVFYMAPEMDFDSRNVTRDKADMFSIGVMMYEYFAKKLPSRGVDYDKYGDDKNTWDDFREPIKINKDIRPSVNRIIKKLMSFDPKDRYSDYGELSRRLSAAAKEYRYDGKRNN